ncbi:MAG: 6-carboxytetrahydropterin synthase, partial [Methanobrevibacter sp.]
ICDELDHRLLIPVYNNLIDFKDFDKDKDSIFDLKNQKSVYFKIDGKGYSLPSVDCVFLPLPYTSAEELSKFFAETLSKKLSETYDNLEYVSVCVNEGIGQGAMYRKDL